MDKYDIFLVEIRSARAGDLDPVKYGELGAIPEAEDFYRQTSKKKLAELAEFPCEDTWAPHPNIYLVGGFNPSEKYESQFR
jgi:hypothetical protein